MTKATKAPAKQAPSTGNPWLSHDYLNAIAFAVLQRGSQFSEQFALDTMRAKGASESEISAGRRLIQARVRAHKKVQRIGKTYPPKWAATGAASASDTVHSASGRVRTRTELTWRINSEYVMTPAGLELDCIEVSPMRGIQVEVLNDRRWIRPSDLVALDEQAERAIRLAKPVDHSDRPTNALTPIDDPQAFTDELFGFDPKTIWVSDDKAMEYIYKHDLRLVNRVLMAKHQTLTHDWKRRILDWTRRSAAGQEWARAQAETQTRYEDSRPAQVERFSKILVTHSYADNDQNEAAE